MVHPMDLIGKRILMVGVSTGLDRAIAQQISRLGAQLVLLDATELVMKEIMMLRDGENHRCYKIDILKCTEIESAVQRVTDECGTFDGFVFSVTHSSFRPLSQMKCAHLEEIMNDNYYTFVEFTRCLMKRKGLVTRGSIVALSSISSTRAMKAKMAFCSAKAALEAAVRCLAVELMEKGVRVNSIQKGVVDADFEKEHIQNIVSLNDSQVAQKQLLGITEAIEVANVVAFLLSDATKTITGTTIVIDGGYTL